MEAEEFWDTKFKTEKTSWGFIPSDSALWTKDFFLANKVKDIPHGTLTFQVKDSCVFSVLRIYAT